MTTQPEPDHRPIGASLATLRTVADLLATAIGELLGDDYGRHSADNNPWQNAIDAAALEIARRRAAMPARPPAARPVHPGAVGTCGCPVMLDSKVVEHVDDCDFPHLIKQCHQWNGWYVDHQLSLLGAAVRWWHLDSPEDTRVGFIDHPAQVIPLGPARVLRPVVFLRDVGPVPLDCVAPMTELPIVAAEPPAEPAGFPMRYVDPAEVAEDIEAFARDSARQREQEETDR